MWFGFTASVVLHAGLLAWALVSFASAPPLKMPEVQPVEVAIITPDDLVRLKKGDRSSKNLKTRKAESPEKSDAKKKPKRIVKAAAPPPPSSEPAPRVLKTKPAPPDPIADKIANLSTPEPDPAEVRRKKAAEAEAKAKADAAAKAKAAAEAKAKAEAEAAAKARAEAEAKKQAEAEAKKQAEAEAKKKAAAEKKRKAAEAKRKLAAKKKREAARRKKLAEAKRRREAEKRKKEFNANRIAALLNKLPEDKRAPSGSQDAPDDRRLPRGAAAGAPEGKDDRLTASQVSMIGVMMKQQTTRCWNINAGLDGAQDLVVEVVVRLKPNGEIDGRPRVENMRQTPQFRDAANSALRALIQCAPYDLPAQFYKGGWDHMVVTFDPNKMF